MPTNSIWRKVWPGGEMLPLSGSVLAVSLKKTSAAGLVL